VLSIGAGQVGQVGQVSNVEASSGSSTLGMPPGSPNNARRPSARTTAEKAKKPLGPICDPMYLFLTTIATGSMEYKSPISVPT